MLSLDKSLDPKILSSAKEEFLKNGFEKTSLREICKKAGVSTGAIYTRYNGKEELFQVLVEDTLQKIDSMFILDQTNSKYSLKKEDRDCNMIDLLFNFTLEPVVHFIYDNYDGFKLLINCSNGSTYGNFLHSFVDKSQEVVLYFSENTNEVKLIIDNEELHLMITAFWSAIFEVVKHDFTREKAVSYCNVLSSFFNWKSICK